jgi:TRAP-type C4-dicarboxylate transport system substrate-binding protein
MRRPATLLVLAALALTGCGGRHADKAGGDTRHPLVLTLANGTSVPWELQPFADEVRRRSGGTIRIEIRSAWRGGRPHFESDLIRDVEAGTVDLGSVGTRAWDRLGVTSFDALHAPFLIDSYVLEEAVLGSEIPGEMLPSLRSIGLAGIGLLPGGFRKPIGVAKPLLRPADFRGLTIGTSEARLARETVRALGATPVTFAPGPTALAGLDGIEFQVTYFDVNTYDVLAKYITANVDLWPRPLVLFASQRTLARLTVSQRRLLRTAARDAVASTVSALQRRDRQAVAALCRRGRVRFVRATDRDQRQLHAAVAPVLASLDAETRSYVASIERLREALGAPAEPAPSCATAPQSTRGAIPNGTYENTMTRKDGRRARIPLNDPFYLDLPIRHKLVITGRNYVLFDTLPDGHVEVSMEGTYSAYRGRIVFSTAKEKLLPISWSFDGRTLRFTDLPFRGSGYYGAMFSPAWTKTG